MKTTILFCFFCLISCLSSSQVVQLDTNFNDDGIVTTSFSDGIDGSNAIVVQPDGKILLGGSAQIDGANTPDYFALLRYNIDGTVDSSFGINGKVYTDISLSSERINDIKLQTDGKIVACGVEVYGNNFAIARYLVNGTIDSTFSQDGFTITEMDSIYWLSQALTLVIDQQGRVVVGGFGYFLDGYGPIDGNADLILTRYLSNGDTDTSFGNNGVVIDNFGYHLSHVNSLALQPDGKIVAGGSAGDLDYEGDPVLAFALARYTSDGIPDASFNGNGKVITPVNESSLVNSIRIQQDGKIIAAGSSRTATEEDDFSVVRYLPDGSFDTQFGDNGMVTVDFNNSSDIAYSVLLPFDGKIILAGNTSNYAWDTTNFAMVRLLENGTIDSSFGTGGKIETDVDPDPFFENETCRAAVLQEDGKILLTGHVSESSGGNWEFVALRYLYDCKQVTAGFTFQQLGSSTQFTNQSLNATTRLWDFGDGTTDTTENPLHLFTLPGDYIVCLVSGNGCSADTICETITILPTSAEQFSMEAFGLNVNPNPFYESTSIHFFLLKSAEISIEVTDLQGRKIKIITEGNFEAGNHQLIFEREDLPPGIYMLKLLTNSFMHSQKLVIQ